MHFSACDKIAFSVIWLMQNNIKFDSSVCIVFMVFKMLLQQELIYYFNYNLQNAIFFFQFITWNMNSKQIFNVLKCDKQISHLINVFELFLELVTALLNLPILFSDLMKQKCIEISFLSIFGAVFFFNSLRRKDKNKFLCYFTDVRQKEKKSKKYLH